jgi:hypothetical protein
VTSAASELVESACALCGRPATQTIEPSRRTMARGADPSDPSYSLTVILPDVALCAEHAQDVGKGSRLIGWCDDQRCRIYGEIGQPSACGGPYKKLGSSNRS